MTGKPSDCLSAGAAFLVVIASCSFVAACGVLVTAGGSDQRVFHMPTVMYLRTTFPNIDISKIPTATGPGYHLFVAGLSGPLHLSATGTQIVGSIFGAALAALAVGYAGAVPTTYGRVLATAPLLLSAYFWESSLWMLTDDAATLFALAALLTMMSFADTRRELTIGILIAGAIATRQTFIWLLTPAVAMCWHSSDLAPLSARLAAITRVSAPGVITLGLLAHAWGGLTPPAMRNFNAGTHSPTSISFVFAVGAIFAIPILLSTSTKVDIRRQVSTAVTVGIAVAAPAIIFPSSATSAPNESRRGGFVWSAVSLFPTIANRSLLLVGLAFFGGFASAKLYFLLKRRVAILLAASLLSLGAVMSVGAQLYQKYVELPIAIFALIAIVCFFRSDSIRRTWPLLTVVIFQTTMTVGIVAFPLLRAVRG